MHEKEEEKNSLLIDPLLQALQKMLLAERLWVSFSQIAAHHRQHAEHQRHVPSRGKADRRPTTLPFSPLQERTHKRDII
jgi:hypothetical protein